jgi:hypothetical protein
LEDSILFRTFLAVFFTLLFTATPSLGKDKSTDWRPIYEKKGIQVSKRSVADSNLMPFRGEGDVDVHIGHLVGVIKTSGVGPEWVDLQVESKELVRVSDESAILYNKYDLSWPVSDRDYVMQQTTTYDAEKKVVTVTYESIVDERFPEDDCCVRAVAVRTFWRFTALEGDKTHVEVEVYTDPKGSIPAWLVNMIQRGWPYNSIKGLAERASKGDIDKHARCTDW